MAIGPINYMAGLPDVDIAGSLMRGLQTGQAYRMGQERVAAQRAQSNRAAMFQQEVSGVNPGDVRQITGLMARYPEFAKELKSAFELQDEDVKLGNLRSMADIYGAALSGDYARAAQVARRRYEADLKAGQADESDLEMVAALESDDPQERNQALTQLGLSLAAMTGPDKFSQTFSTLNQQRQGVTLNEGQTLYDPISGQVIAQAPREPKYMNIDGNLVEVGGGAGIGMSGDFSSGTAADVSETFNRMLQRESGGRQFDRSGNPITSPKGAVGIAQVMPKTAPEAAALAGLPWDAQRYRNDADYNRALGEAYFQKQVSDFGDPAKAAAAYNAGPGAVRKAIARAEQSGNPENWLSFLPKETRDYVPAVTRQSEQSGARVLFSAARDAGAQAQRMTPEEAAAEGLDPSVTYYRNKDGIPVPVSGQATPQMRAAEQQKKQLATTNLRNALAKARNLAGVTSRAIDLVSPLSAGIGYGGSGNIPGTPARNLSAELSTLKASLAFGELQAMREASPTGGALGAVSNIELNLLESAVASLDQGQSPEKLRASLERVQKHYANWVRIMGDAYNETTGNQPVSKRSARNINPPKNGEYLGTSGGNPVYRLPNGETVVYRGK